MKHPKIPPNCDFFHFGLDAALKPKFWFLAPCTPRDSATSAGPSFQYIEMDDPLWKQVIASVAYRYWHKAQGDLCAEANIENAEAWIKWAGC